jgi:DNA-binding IclR family transcriptional regulator
MSSESARTRRHDEPASAGVQSVDRALRLLKAVAASGAPSSAQELARRCGVNRSTAWRLLATLEAHGLVERDAVTGRYAVGYAAFQLATAEDHDALARRLRPLLEHTAGDRRDRHPGNAKRSGLVCVDQRTRPGRPRRTGRAATSVRDVVGKVFWPGCPRTSGPPCYRPRSSATCTIVVSGPDRELERVRRDGYASCLGEYDFSTASRPPCSARLPAVAIVNVWGPSLRVTRARLPSLGRNRPACGTRDSLLLV